MKRTLVKLFAVCAFLLLSSGFSAGHVFAQSDIVIDTNGNVEINGGTNTVTISPDGNGPLVINNINLPNQNLVINGNPNQQPLISFQGNPNPGPVIQVFSQNNSPALISTGAIQLPQEETGKAVSDAVQFPQIVQLEQPETSEEPMEWITSEKTRPSGAVLNAAGNVSSSLASAAANLSEPVYINIQNIQEANNMAATASGEIVLS